MFVEWKNVWINPETKHRLNINRLSQFNEVPRLTLSFLHCFPYFPPLLSICSACFVGTSFITSFSTLAKNVRIISFFLEQSFGIRRSLKCLLNFFFISFRGNDPIEMVYNDWALLIRHSRKASWVFSKKNIFFRSGNDESLFFLFHFEW